MYALDDRFWNSEGSIHALPGLLLEEHNDSGFIQKQTPDEILAHAPELSQFLN